MGLTIHYELRLPTSTGEDEVDRIVAALHAYARTLPFEHVSPVTAVSCTPFEMGRENGWASCLEGWAFVIAEPFDEEANPFTGDITTARGFLVNPGDGCETAVFGFLRRADFMGIPDGWYWETFCKTQYASTIGDDHFVRCHTSLAALLDRAIRLGVAVTVHDETGYWETRDTAQFDRAARAMNRLVAMLAGKIEIVAGPDYRVESPIFDHRLFERLEMGELGDFGDIRDIGDVGETGEWTEDD